MIAVAAAAHLKELEEAKAQSVRDDHSYRIKPRWQLGSPA